MYMAKHRQFDQLIHDIMIRQYVDPYNLKK